MPTPPNPDQQKVLNEYAEQVLHIAELLSLHANHVSHLSGRMYEWDRGYWYENQIEMIYGVTGDLQEIILRLKEASSQITTERNENDIDIQFPF